MAPSPSRFFYHAALTALALLGAIRLAQGRNCLSMCRSWAALTANELPTARSSTLRIRRHLQQSHFNSLDINILAHNINNQDLTSIHQT
jgi:hypothetical protein